MAVTHPTTSTRNTLADAIDTAIGASGNLVFYVTTTEVATCPFSATAFGAAAAGVITAAAITDDSSATGNASAVNKVDMETSGGTPIVSCSNITAASGGGEIEISGGTTIGAGATVSVSSLTYTAPV
jgi:hypothetical protein